MLHDHFAPSKAHIIFCCKWTGPAPELVHCDSPTGACIVPQGIFSSTGSSKTIENCRRACHSAGGCDGRATARPRGATPRLRSGAEAGRTPCPKGGSQEELPHVRGQGQWPRVPDCVGAETVERSYPETEVSGGGLEEIPSIRGQGRRLGGATPRPHARGQRRWPEELPGAVAARAHEGLEELSHIEGQEGQR